MGNIPFSLVMFYYIHPKPHYGNGPDYRRFGDDRFATV